MAKLSAVACYSPAFRSALPSPLNPGAALSAFAAFASRTASPNPQDHRCFSPPKPPSTVAEAHALYASWEDRLPHMRRPRALRLLEAVIAHEAFASPPSTRFTKVVETYLFSTWRDGAEAASSDTANAGDLAREEPSGFLGAMEAGNDGDRGDLVEGVGCYDRGDPWSGFPIVRAEARSSSPPDGAGVGDTRDGGVRPDGLGSSRRLEDSLRALLGAGHRAPPEAPTSGPQHANAADRGPVSRTSRGISPLDAEARGAAPAGGPPPLPGMDEVGGPSTKAVIDRLKGRSLELPRDKEVLSSVYSGLYRYLAEAKGVPYGFKSRMTRQPADEGKGRSSGVLEAFSWGCRAGELEPRGLALPRATAFGTREGFAPSRAKGGGSVRDVSQARPC